MHHDKYGLILNYSRRRKCRKCWKHYNLNAMTCLPVFDHELSDRYQFLTWEEVKKMSDSGMAIGSHTHTHPMLSTMTADESLHELTESKRLLEKTYRTTLPVNELSEW